ncbi:MAG: hypothetical protein IPP81_19940 [Chitinophagaceae bacterium]|nr:hypothetical protein [Chitinophagaceae bacterium]
MKILLCGVLLLIITSCQEQAAKPKTNSSTTIEKKTSPVATITEIKVKDDFIYPIITFADKAKEDKINTYLINSTLGDEFKLSTLTAQLTEQSKQTQGLSSLSYKVLVNMPTLLSISISSCWTGARENCGEGQYNFDLTTGYNFTLDQVINPSKWNNIIQLVCNDAKKRLVDAKADAKKELGNSWHEKDMLNLTYEGQWKDEYNKLQYCGIEVGKNFKLTEDGMSFYFCQMGFLPMSIRELMPNDEYFYPWSTLKPFLTSSSPISSLIK